MHVLPLGTQREEYPVSVLTQLPSAQNIHRPAGHILGRQIAIPFTWKSESDFKIKAQCERCSWIQQQ